MVVHGTVTSVSSRIEVQSEPWQGHGGNMYGPLASRYWTWSDMQPDASLPSETERAKFVEDERAIGRLVAGRLENP